MSSESESKKQPDSGLYKLLSLLPIEKFKSKAPVVTVLRMQGMIASGGGIKSSLSLESVNENIEQAFDTPKLKAVALIINSPGGSPVQSELIFKRIRSLADEKKIPVIAFTEDIAASGGYWLLCAGDELYASEMSIVGSIGVITGGFGFHETIKKLGIERRLYTQGKNKAVLDPFSPEREEDVKIIKNIQKDIHESFKNLVRTRRAGKLKANEDKLFNGEFWSGKQAQELGLVDHIGDMYQVIREKFGQDVKFKKIGKDKGWLKKKLGLSGLGDQFLDRIIERLSFERFGL
jgi:signal peptide peptidase SppA